MKTIVLQNVARTRAAGFPLALKSFTALAFDGIRITARDELPSVSKRTTTRTILLVSEDAALSDGLCLVAAQNSLSVARTPSLREAMEEANRVQPTAVLLDLDFPTDAGWQTAEWFLGHEPRVPVLFLTGHADHYELGAAIRSGTVFEKSRGAARLLHAIESMLEESKQQGQGRIALQQAWLRQARPYRWKPAVVSGYRYWGINE